LQAGGYAVDVAASTGEALAKLDDNVYDLVLTDERFGKTAATDLLAYARVKEYHPATAIITGQQPQRRYRAGHGNHVSVYTENLPHLLERVAYLIGMRASRRYRLLRQAV
jgi:DNA-binding NtrC family response regulator